MDCRLAGRTAPVTTQKSPDLDLISQEHSPIIESAIKREPEALARDHAFEDKGLCFRGLAGRFLRHPEGDRPRLATET